MKIKGWTQSFKIANKVTKTAATNKINCIFNFNEINITTIIFSLGPIETPAATTNLKLIANS